MNDELYPYGIPPNGNALDSDALDAEADASHAHAQMLRQAQLDLFGLHWSRRHSDAGFVREMLLKDGLSLLASPEYRKAVCVALHATDGDEALANASTSDDDDAALDMRPRFRLNDIVTYRGDDAIFTLPVHEYRKCVEPYIGRYADYLNTLPTSIDMQEERTLASLYAPAPEKTLHTGFMHTQIERALFSQPKEAWVRSEENGEVLHSLTLAGKARLPGFADALMQFLHTRYPRVIDMEPGVRCDNVGNDVVVRMPPIMFDRRICADIIAYALAHPAADRSPG